MKSDPDRELAIFTEALKLQPKEREAFLERKCLRDKALRQRIEALLRAHERLGNFLEEPPTDDPSIERN
jgi:eukaryotic-like serine/threonine-protein kinase